MAMEGEVENNTIERGGFEFESEGRTETSREMEEDIYKNYNDHVKQSSMNNEKNTQAINLGQEKKEPVQVTELSEMGPEEKMEVLEKLDSDVPDEVKNEVRMNKLEEILQNTSDGMGKMVFGGRFEMEVNRALNEIAGK